MQRITLSLVVSLIMEAVKSETLIKGRVDKAVDDKAAELAYQEEAGDQDFHERKLLRTLHTSLAHLKSKIGDYMDTANSSLGDNISYAFVGDNATIEMSLLVSDRFNRAFCDTLAKLCSKFIEDHMLFLWWGTFNVKQAEFYKTLYTMDLTDIVSCFSKTAPAVPTTAYASTITTQMGDTIRADVGEIFTVTYQVMPEDCVDDVEARVNGYARIGDKIGKSFTVVALNPGVTTLTLYSKHDEDVSKNVKLIIS